MSKIPTIVQVIPLEDYVIEVHFQNQCVKRYDMLPLIETDPEIKPLRDPRIFREVQVSFHDRRRSIYWPGVLRVSAKEIYEGGWIEKLPSRQMTAFRRYEEIWGKALEQLGHMH
ncbi:DUF2442 domain-containing protein [Pseudoramibacter porci]|uniref:DUF2442 domain-containing protein n=1 Tax=Pseudoramibacter porci TaxID=2606631 RepID=A0A7X2NGL2_9FIRM|nr:DUF2442 domain-containing protein [Pseudoramibacter porci]MSS20254.1 DUF2442 domain-containing protein [Pseudoramibacter porci]